MGGWIATGATSGIQQLANLTSTVSIAMESTVGDFSLNQTVGELSVAATFAIQVCVVHL